MTNKSRWQRAYNTQPTPESLEGGLRQFNGYRHPRTYQLLLASIQQATQGWQGCQILDAGCGSGSTGSFLQAGNTITGADFSHQMAQHAAAIYPGVTVADVEQLPFADQVFDGVLAVGVWQCLAPDTPFLKEVARVLRPGGQAVFGWILNADYLLYKRGVTFRLDPSVQLSLLSAERIPILLADAGLSIQQLYAVIFPFGVIKMRRIPRWLRPFVPAFTVSVENDQYKKFDD